MEFKQYFDENYFVSKCGKVKNKKGIIMTPQNKKSGYQFYYLYLNGKAKKVLAHRMVMIAWKPRVDFIFMTVNHKDGNKTNNQLDNLEWMTNQENRKHYLDNLHVYKHPK